MATEDDSSISKARSLVPARERVFGFAIVALWLLLWEIMVRSVPKIRFLSPPSEFLSLLFQSLLSTGDLWPHLWATFQRLVIGLVIGALPGMWLGRAIGRSESRRHRWGPITFAIGLLPVVSLLPSFTIWFGVGEINKWAVVSWAVFLPAVYFTSTLFRMTESPQGQVHSGDLLKWPQNSSWIFLALKQSSMVGVLAVLSAEMWASKVGLGFIIATAGMKFEVPVFHMAMAAAALMMYVLWLALTGIKHTLGRRNVGTSTDADN
jgi:NitT/TauT family transport system permease protein